MIEKAIAYKKTDKDFISSLKKLGLSKDEINFILKKHKRKKFEEGGDSGPGGSDDGTGHGGVGSVGPSDDGFGIGPDAAAEAEASAAANAPATGVVGAITGFAQQAMSRAMNNPVATAIGIAMGPVAGFAAQAISNAISAANRGVTGPSDDTQESASVQSSTQSPSGGGGINTLQAYAPLYNSPGTSGDQTMDAYIRRLRLNLGLPV